MRRGMITGILILICFVLQCTVFRIFAFGGIVPNLLIVLTASFGFMRGEKTGLIIGFFCGLMIDVFFSDVIGFYALVYMYIGYANGKFARQFYPEDIKMPMFLITCSDFGYGLICYLFLFLLRGKLDIGYYILHVVIPEVVYTLIVTVFLYPVILKINFHLEAKEKRSAKKFV